MKQVLVVRADLKMDRGKMAAQCAHASVEAVLQSDKKTVDTWHATGMKKVVLKVTSLGELLIYHKLAKKQKLVSVLITDGAKTFFKEPTETCVGIGPAAEESIDCVTGKLPMY
ncbi:MAG: aminoacyl-tRNA hydrolase [Nanoarchaeota archaeon]